MQKSGREACHCPAHRACCGTLSCIPHYCTPGTAGRRTHNTIGRRSGDHIPVGGVPTLG